MPVVELTSMMPDSILFGSLILYFLTHNLSYGVFSIFIFELSLSHRIISWMFSQTVGPASRSSDNTMCRAGFKTPQYAVQQIFSHDTYPSYSLFSLTAIATYLGLSTHSVSEILEQLGPYWNVRSILSYVFIAFVLLIFLFARFLGCDESMGEIGIAMLTAVLVGVCFFYANKKLFGAEAVNFLGLPNMVQQTSQDGSIFVCSQQS
jgi:hypothetical protein